jgi:hypothetical protein
MRKNQKARAALVAASNALMERRANTTDPAEKSAIDDAIDLINVKIGFMNQAGLLQAAQAVKEAAAALQKVVDSAQMGPFDNVLDDVKGAINRLEDLHEDLQK